MSDTQAAILGGAIGGLIGGVFGVFAVWLTYYFGKRASEADRRAEKLVTVYREIEVLWNLIDAKQNGRLTHTQFYPKWAETSENILVALIGSGLDGKRVLTALNGKWNEPNTATALRALADELLEKIDPGYARAAKEMLIEQGIKPEDIGQVII